MPVTGPMKSELVPRENGAILAPSSSLELIQIGLDVNGNKFCKN